MSAIDRLADDIYKGSKKAFILRHNAEFSVFAREHNRLPTKQELENFENPPSQYDQTWYLGPDGVRMPGESEYIQLPEFIGGIAVACGITPELKEIKAVISSLMALCLYESVRNG